MCAFTRPLCYHGAWVCTRLCLQYSAVFKHRKQCVYHKHMYKTLLIILLNNVHNTAATHTQVKEVNGTILEHESIGRVIISLLLALSTQVGI